MPLKPVTYGINMDPVTYGSKDRKAGNIGLEKARRRWTSWASLLTFALWSEACRLWITLFQLLVPKGLQVSDQ